MTNHPLISIALCTYNGEKFLAEQLDSLVNQDYSNIEIIAVDDCSVDCTVEILKLYAAQYPFIKIYQNEFNLGYVKNFEKAISVCTGEYIALADQDDIWALNKIRLLYENIHGHILIYHDSAFINEQGVSINKNMSDVTNLYKGSDSRPFLFGNCISGHALLFKKCLIKYIIPFNKSYFHDYWIAYVATNHGSIGLVEECLVNYRQHDNASTDILKKKIQKKEKKSLDKEKKLIDWIALCKKHSSAENYTFINHLYQLMLLGQQSNSFNFKLAFFLIRNMKKIYYIHKKSTWSILNLIRRQCRPKEH